MSEYRLILKKMILYISIINVGGRGTYFTREEEWTKDYQII